MSLDTGDLVFFQTRRNRIHVGIFLGGSEFFHLSSRNRAGKVDKIDSTYFSTRFISGVRLKETNRPAKLQSPTGPGSPAASPRPQRCHPRPRRLTRREADHLYLLKSSKKIAPVLSERIGAFFSASPQVSPREMELRLFPLLHACPSCLPRHHRPQSATR